MDNRKLVERLKRPVPQIMVDGLARGDMALAAARIELLEAEIAKLRREIAAKP